MASSGRRLQTTLRGDFTDGTDWASFTSAQVSGGIPCTPANSFTHLNFDGASLVRSNLGGQGGRCYSRPMADPPVDWTDLCEEQCDITNGPCTSPQEIYIRNVGTAPGSVTMDLRITNESECAR